MEIKHDYKTLCDTCKKTGCCRYQAQYSQTVIGAIIDGDTSWEECPFYEKDRIAEKGCYNED